MARDIIFEPSRAISEFRLLPGFTTRECQSGGISLKTRLAVNNDGTSFLTINIPLVAAAMQAVSGVTMGIELARQGGAAFIYSSQPIESQAQMIRKIKSHKAGFVKPRTVLPDTGIKDLAKQASQEGFSTFPVVDAQGHLVGLITKNDFSPLAHAGLTAKDRMIPRKNLVVGSNVTNLRQANEILMESHQSVLPIVDSEDRLLFLVFRKDIENHLYNPDEVIDSRKRLFAAAAINTHDYETRIPALVEAEVDLLCVDSSDGHTFFQKTVLEWIRQRYPGLPVIGGNIVTGEGFRFLAEAGASGVKIGMGGGSICITQEQKGTGRGLGTAIIDVVQARDTYFHDTGRYLPLIADGGIVTAKDMVIALALGADSVMAGRYFARMEESPTEKINLNNRIMKPYWGEGSPRAREWRTQRYQQVSFAEGVEGYVEYAGTLKDNLAETLAIMKSSLSSAGAASVLELHEKSVVEVVSALSIREGQVHDIQLAGNTSGFLSKNWGG